MEGKKEIEDWSKVVDGSIDVPDELDRLMNRAAFHYQICHISKRISWQEMLARIVLDCQLHFTNSKLKEESEVSNV